MNTAESQILSILRTGEMLRFVFRPHRNKRIEVAIEGASETPATSALLGKRLGLVLSELRDSGYVFEGRKRALPRLSRSKANARRRNLAKPVWLKIQPRTVPCTAEKPGLGFQSSAGNEKPAEILMPDIPASGHSRIFECLTSLLVTIPRLELFEMEFIRTDLPSDLVRPLQEALRLAVLAQSAPPPFDMKTLPQAFLALWLSQRTGWEVNVRVCLRSAKELPIAPLEMVGRDIFRCECEVVLETQAVEDRTAVQLRACFPRGWEFPSILPPVTAGDMLTVSKVRNRNLPNLPKKGTIIGIADGAPVRLPIPSRDRHTYIVGATGTGKSTLLARMIREDIERGEGVVLLDPHGDLYRATLQAIPPHRKGEVFQLDPSVETNIPGVNILDLPPSKFRRRHAAFIVGELFRLFEELWNMREAGGPAFEMYFRNTLLLLCLQKETEGTPWTPYTLHAFTKALSDEGFRKHLLANCTERSVVEFWTDIAERTSGDYRLANWVPYITCKINGLTQTGYVSDLLSAERNDFRIGERMSQGQIVLVNLNKGLLGTYESRLLGTILMMEIFAAGLQRSMLPESERRPVNVYVDEFQNFVSDNVASMLSEARKFGIRLTLANQTLAQLRATPGRQDLLETVLGNVGNVILFRLGVPDADRLKLFIEPFSRQEMQELPNFHALARLLTPEGPVRPLIMKTLKP